MRRILQQPSPSSAHGNELDNRNEKELAPGNGSCHSQVQPERDSDTFDTGSLGFDANSADPELEQEQREADEWIITQGDGVQPPEFVEVETEVVVADMGEEPESSPTGNIPFIDQQGNPPKGTDSPPVREELWSHSFWQKKALKKRRSASNLTAAGRLARCSQYAGMRDENGCLNRMRKGRRTFRDCRRKRRKNGKVWERRAAEGEREARVEGDRKSRLNGKPVPKNQ